MKRPNKISLKIIILHRTIHSRVMLNCTVETVTRSRKVVSTSEHLLIAWQLKILRAKPITS